MTILDRWVGGTFLRLFAGFVVGAPILFVVGDLVEKLDQYLDRGIPPARVAVAYLHQLPQFVLWSFPIAGLIAAVFTIHGMTTRREIVAAKAGGISFHRILLPIVVLGALLTGGALALAQIAPWGMRQASDILESRQSRLDWRSEFVVQSEDGRALSVRRISVGTATMEGVVMTRPGSAGTPTVITSAEAGSWTAGKGWVFLNGQVRLVPEAGEEQTFSFARLRTGGLPEAPEDFVEEMRAAEEMTWEELTRYIGVIQRSGGEAEDLRVERQQKIAIPVATLVILLFGAPLATSSKRGGAAYGVGISLGSTILYMILLRFSGALGDTGNLDPVLAAWLPNALFLAAGLVLLSRVRT